MPATGYARSGSAAKPARRRGIDDCQRSGAIRHRLQRRDQSPGTRAEVPVMQDDKAFARPDDKLTKFNPLANWTSQQVWDYIRQNNVPYNSLHDKGFVSIGCEPCTRPTGPGQHEREGRWWWEEATMKECGLHAVNIEK